MGVVPVGVVLWWNGRQKNGRRWGCEWLPLPGWGAEPRGPGKVWLPWVWLPWVRLGRPWAAAAGAVVAVEADEVVEEGLDAAEEAAVGRRVRRRGRGDGG